VVNGQRKGSLKGQVSYKEMNANESLKKCRKRKSRRTKSHYAKDAEKSMAATCLLAMRPPAYRRHDLITGFITEHGISVLGEIKQYLVLKRKSDQAIVAKKFL